MFCLFKLLLERVDLSPVLKYFFFFGSKVWFVRNWLLFKILGVNYVIYDIESKRFKFLSFYDNFQYLIIIDQINKILSPKKKIKNNIT